jgi:hypothetical protein
VKAKDLSAPLCSVKVKNEWSYISTTPVWPTDVDRDSFTFYQVT